MVGTGEKKHYNTGTNVKVLNSKREVFFYVSKYMGKTEDDEGCACPGRFWDVVNPKNITTGERKRIYCTGKQATQLMRFMRRYVHAATRRKYRFNRWSMNCMCTVDTGWNDYQSCWVHWHHHKPHSGRGRQSIASKSQYIGTQFTRVIFE